MDEALERQLLFDTYGELLTQRQRQCFDLRCNQDMSLGEIGEVLQISRQGVFDNLGRGMARMRRMEEELGCIRRAERYEEAARIVRKAARELSSGGEPQSAALAQELNRAAELIEE